MATTTETLTYMNNHFFDEPKTRLSIIPDPDTSISGSEEAFQQVTNPRVQFLKLTTFARTSRGIPGKTYPFCPSGPTLARQPYPGTEEEGLKYLHQGRPSPLQHIALTAFSRKTASRMPHATNMPNSGFQALILCGPGIGLSTFTNKPEDNPKALVPVANRPMVWYVLDWCYRMGVSDITLVTPPASQPAIAAALAQNPYLTSLPSPTPDLLAPTDLDHTTPTAELLRLPEIQAAIKSDFLLLPCDLVCDVPGDTFLETYLTSLGGLGGVGASSDNGVPKIIGFGGEKSGRRGGLSVWYNTANREESVKGEECDFMGTVKLDSQYHVPLSKPVIAEQSQGALRKLVIAMPMSELKDECEENKEWRIRQSLLSKYGSLKCLTKYRDSHIYLFPYWVKDFAMLNEDFESVSEDLVGTWAKADWRKPSYRARFGATEIFRPKKTRRESRPDEGPSVEEEIDLLSLSSTQTTQHKLTTVSTPRRAQLASRVPADPDDSILSPNEDDDDDEFDDEPPMFPPMLSYIHPSSSTAPLIRRIDMTPLLLSVSLLLAKIPAVDDPSAPKQPSPFAHASKVSASATISREKVTISRADTLIDANTTIATGCVIKSSVIGSSATIGQGTRITNCVIMDGSVIGDKCVLNGCVVGKKSSIGKGSNLTNCEVQDGNVVAEATDGKGEKYLVGGLEDELSGDELGEGMEEEAFDAFDEGDAGISIG